MNHRTPVLALSLWSLLLPLAGCKSAEQREAERAERAAAKEAKEREQAEKLAALQAEVRARLPADSPLQQLTFGMSEAEVAAKLGAPTSQHSRATGKAWNPFNVTGKDTVRTTFYYRGIGRVVFSSGSWGQRNGVVDLVHDADEPGHEVRETK